MPFAFRRGLQSGIALEMEWDIASLISLIFSLTGPKPVSSVLQLVFFVIAGFAFIHLFTHGIIWTLIFSAFMLLIGVASLLFFVEESEEERIRKKSEPPKSFPSEPMIYGANGSVKDRGEILSQSSETQRNILTSSGLQKVYPWINLNIPKCVDDSLTKLAEILISQYLAGNWYQYVQARRNFLCESRVATRYISSALIRRLSRVELSAFIHDKVSAILVDHVTVYLHLRNHAAQEAELDIDVLLKKHPGLSHPAVEKENGLDELFFDWSSRIVAAVVPGEFRRCPATTSILREVVVIVFEIIVESLSESHQVNYLVKLAIETLQKEPENGSEVDISPVPILKDLVPDDKTPSTVQRLSFRQILAEPTLKNTFEQQLKALELDDFFKIHESMEWINKVMEHGVISESLMHSVFVTLGRLQKDILVAQSKGYVFPEDFLRELAEILSLGMSGAVKIRSMSSWKSTYYKLSNILETILVPSFQETRLYHHLLIPPTEEVPKKPLRRVYSTPVSKKSSRDSLQSFSETVRGALRDVPPVMDVDQPVFDEDDENLPDDDFDDIDNDFAVTEDALGSKLRDLSYYEVEVNRAERRRDDQGRIFMVLNIIVADNGPLSPDKGKKWVVQRRYVEFYNLDAKIREFHGPMEASTHLPPKRAWFSPSLEYLQLRLKAFEKFLQSLTREPKLRYSQMLYNFMATTMDFDGPSGFPDLGLGKVIRSVPQMLTAERGQNVECFVRSLLNIAMPGKPKSVVETPVRPSGSELDSTEENCVEKLSGDFIFVPLEELDSELESTASVLASDFDKLVYIASTFLRSDSELTSLLSWLRSYLHQPVDAFLRQTVNHFISFVSAPGEISFLLDLLSELLVSTEPSSDAAEKAKRKRETEALLNSFEGNEWVNLVCGENSSGALKLAFDLLQYKTLNKRLVLKLLETAVDELFPQTPSGDSGDCIY